MTGGAGSGAAIGSGFGSGFGSGMDTGGVGSGSGGAGGLLAQPARIKTVTIATIKMRFSFMITS
jgi:hypothetical protein